MGKMRPLGTILLELEPLLQEAMDSHDLQWGDIMGLLHHYLMVHYPNAQEQYNDGTSPVYFYGHQELVANFLQRLKKAK